jgi:hypothetical protein
LHFPTLQHHFKPSFMNHSMPLFAISRKRSAFKNNNPWDNANAQILQCLNYVCISFMKGVILITCLNHYKVL